MERDVEQAVELLCDARTRRVNANLFERLGETVYLDDATLRKVRDHTIAQLKETMEAWDDTAGSD